MLPPQVRMVDLGADRIRDIIVPLRAYLRREQPDGLQALMWPLTIVAVIAHRLARSKARLILADHTALSKHYGYFGKARTWALRASIRHFYPKADARVIVSERAADDLADLAGIPRESIEVIYNPVASPPPGKVAAPEIAALWGEGARILTIGNLNAEKNHELLIRAFARVAARRPATLIIAGEGAMRARLEQVAAEEGVADRVILPGFATDSWSYYLSAELFVLSSDYEGFGLVLVEAMRCGLRIVSTDCEAGPREILDGGKYGTLVPPGDIDALAEAMLAALDAPIDPARQAARVDHLSGPAVLNRYLELMTGSPA